MSNQLIIDSDRVLGMLTANKMLTVRPAAGFVVYTSDEDGQLWKRIGRVSVSCYTSLIDVWPCAGSHFTVADLDTLKEWAVAAWLNPPSKHRAWPRKPGGEYGPFWEVTVSVPVALSALAAQ